MHDFAERKTNGQINTYSSIRTAMDDFDARIHGQINTYSSIRTAMDDFDARIHGQINTNSSIRTAFVDFAARILRTFRASSAATHLCILDLQTHRDYVLEEQLFLVHISCAMMMMEYITMSTTRGAIDSSSYFSCSNGHNENCDTVQIPVLAKTSSIWPYG